MREPKATNQRTGSHLKRLHRLDERPQTDPTEEQQNDQKHDNRQRPVPELWPHPCGSPVEDQKRERKDREQECTRNRIRQLDFTKAPKQSEHRNGGDKEEIGAIGRGLFWSFREIQLAY